MTIRRLSTPALACIAAAGAFLFFTLSRTPPSHAGRPLRHSGSPPSEGILATSIPHSGSDLEANGGTYHTPTRALEYQPGPGATDRRIESVQRMAREAPDPTDLYASLGALFLRRYRETSDDEHLRRTEDAVRAALSRAPEHPLGLALEGQLAMQGHHFDDAAELADRMLMLDPADVAALLLRGDAQLELGRYEEALESYQTAANLRPDLRTYDRGAHMRWLHGDIEGSLELLRAAVEAGSPRDPESTAWCLVEVANVQLHFGNLDQPRSALRSALALVPDYLPALRARARLETAEGRRALALATLDTVLARSESVGDLLFSSELLALEGRVGEAMQRRARAEQIAREDPRSLALYRARHDEDIEAALETLEHEITLRDDVGTHSALALALARVGRLEEARLHLDRARRLDTPDLALRADAALTLQLVGDTSEAERLARMIPHDGFSPWLMTRLRRTTLGETLAGQELAGPELAGQELARGLRPNDDALAARSE